MSSPIIAYIIIAAIIVLPLALYGVYRHRTRFIIDWQKEDDDDLAAVVGCPPVSVVIVCQNEAGELEENVPRLMGQTGIEAEYIIVNAASTDTTADAIKRLHLQHPSLRQTYLPKSHSIQHLWQCGCILGARAARHEWVLFVHPDFAPSSPAWLLDLMRYADDSTCAVVDYGHTTELEEAEESGFGWQRRYKAMARTVSRGRAIVTAGGSLLIRKDWLLERGDEAERSECVYLCRRFLPLSRVILRVQNRRPLVAGPW